MSLRVFLKLFLPEPITVAQLDPLVVYFLLYSSDLSIVPVVYHTRVVGFQSKLNKLAHATILRGHLQTLGR